MRLFFVVGVLLAVAADAVEIPLPQEWEYRPSVTAIAKNFAGREGVVLHVGASMTYANPYGQWARTCPQQTDAEKSVLEWMHTNADDTSLDGWYLARVDREGGHSDTACSGITAEELLKGSREGFASFEKMLDTYRPQLVVLMVGTNDASRQRPVEAYRNDFDAMLKLMIERGVVPIPTTLPPHPKERELGKQCNEAIRALAKQYGLRMIDLEREILLRRSEDWNGTLLTKDDVHLSAAYGGTEANSPATVDHLRNSGYLLRCWVTVNTIAEIKREVLDKLPPHKAGDAIPGAAGQISNGIDYPTRIARPSDEVLAKAERVRLPVTRDLWISSVPEERLGSNGGSPKLKCKSYQEMSLVDVDAASVKDREVLWAELHLHGGDLAQVSLSGVAAEWHEGAGTSYDSPPGASSFAFRQLPDVAWTEAGGDLANVVFGARGTRWSSAAASPPDADGFQVIPFDGRLLADRGANRSYGFLVFDDTGSEWSRDGEQFKAAPFPNRFFASREAGEKTAPFVVAWLGEGGSAGKKTLTDPPKPTVSAKVVLPELRGQKPQMNGKVLFPSHKNIHFPEKGPLLLTAAQGETVGFRVRDISRNDGDSPITFWSVEFAWESTAAPGTASISEVEPLADQILGIPEIVWGAGGEGIGAAVRDDALFKFDWLLEIEPRLTCKPGTYTAYLNFDFVYGKKGIRNSVVNHQRTLIPVTLRVLPVRLPAVPTFLCEMNCYDLPKNEIDYYRMARRHRTVLNRVPYYHRGEVATGCAPAIDEITQLRKSGPMKFDWTEWDKRFGPLFDGSAFAGLPTGREPIECFYLPMFENSPVPIEENYDSHSANRYWADRAFNPRYAPRFESAVKAFAEHLNEKDWLDTRFHVYFNGKNNFKQNGWSRGTCPWLLDEPAHFQDFVALRWFGDRVKAGLAAADAGPMPPQIMFRCDISRPQWQRDMLDGSLRYNVVAGGAFDEYRELILDRKRRTGELTLVYGSTEPPGVTPPMQPALWCIEAWCMGADGVLPWQTVGNAESWKKADAEALFYPSEGNGDTPANGPPSASLRLKSYRYGQQMCEYLNLYVKKSGHSREAVGRAVIEKLKLKGTAAGTGFIGGEDAGKRVYDEVKIEKLEALRLGLGDYLSHGG